MFFNRNANAVDYVIAMSSSERLGVTPAQAAEAVGANFFDAAKDIDAATYGDNPILKCTEVNEDGRTRSYWSKR